MNLIQHPTDDTLELYALGRLQEPELEQVETHLFVCEHCQTSVLEADEYAGALTSALRELGPRERVSWWRRIQWMPVAPILGSAMAAMLVVSVLLRPAPDLAPASVTLYAQRGGTADVSAHAPAGAPLDLKIRSSLLTTGPVYRLSIVDETGRRSWAGQVTGDVAHIPSGLDAGSYWVRLYDAQDRLLQEYGLKLD